MNLVAEGERIRIPKMCFNRPYSETLSILHNYSISFSIKRGNTIEIYVINYMASSATADFKNSKLRFQYVCECTSH